MVSKVGIIEDRLLLPPAHVPQDKVF